MGPDKSMQAQQAASQAIHHPASHETGSPRVCTQSCVCRLDTHRYTGIYTHRHICALCARKPTYTQADSQRHVFRGHTDTPACTHTRAHRQAMTTLPAGPPVGKFLCKSDLILSSCKGIVSPSLSSGWRMRAGRTPRLHIFGDRTPISLFLGQNCSPTLLIPHSAGMHLLSLHPCPDLPLLRVSGRKASCERQVRACGGVNFHGLPVPFLLLTSGLHSPSPSQSRALQR